MSDQQPRETGTATEIDRLRADNHRLRLGSMSTFDYERLVEWMKDPDRKPPEIAFTAGAARDAARAAKESGCLDSAQKDRIRMLQYDNDKLRAQIEVLKNPNLLYVRLNDNEVESTETLFDNNSNIMLDRDSSFDPVGFEFITPCKVTAE